MQISKTLRFFFFTPVGIADIKNINDSGSQWCIPAIQVALEAETGGCKSHFYYEIQHSICVGDGDNVPLQKATLSQNISALAIFPLALLLILYHSWCLHPEIEWGLHTPHALPMHPLHQPRTSELLLLTSFAIAASLVLLNGFCCHNLNIQNSLFIPLMIISEYSVPSSVLS